MLNYQRNGNKFTTANGGRYSVAVWKNNHCAFGHYTDGCWMTVHRGSRGADYDSHRATADLWAAKLSGYTRDEWLELYEISDELGFTLYITDSQVYFHDPKYNKIIVTADKTGRAQVKAGIERIAADRNKPVPKPKAQQKEEKRAAAVARSRALLTPEARAKYDAEVTAKELTHSIKGAPELKHGLTADHVLPYRAWAAPHSKAFMGVKLADRITMYKAGTPPKASEEPAAAPVAKGTAELTDAQFAAILHADAHETHHGLPPEKVPAFRQWVKGLKGAFRQMPMSAKVAAFLAGGKAEDWEVVLTEPEPQPVEEKAPPVLVHDAHVFAYRRRRANRLKALRRVTVRDGQMRFRTGVLANYEGCAITGITTGIEAAHVIPDALLDDMRPANGLPLVGFLHSAFDSLLFSIEPVTLAVHVAPQARAWLNIEGRTIADGKIWPLDRSALAHHFERFKEAIA